MVDICEKLNRPVISNFAFFPCGCLASRTTVEKNVMHSHCTQCVPNIKVSCWISSDCFNFWLFLIFFFYLSSKTIALWFCLSYVINYFQCCSPTSPQSRCASNCRTHSAESFFLSGNISMCILTGQRNNVGLVKASHAFSVKDVAFERNRFLWVLRMLVDFLCQMWAKVALGSFSEIWRNLLVNLKHR